MELHVKPVDFLGYHPEFKPLPRVYDNFHLAIDSGSKRILTAFAAEHETLVLSVDMTDNEHRRATKSYQRKTYEHEFEGEFNVIMILNNRA